MERKESRRRKCFGRHSPTMEGIKVGYEESATKTTIERKVQCNEEMEVAR